MQLTKAAVILWIIGCLLLSNPLAMAEERISDNYIISKEVLSNGGSAAVSANYKLNSTTGQSFAASKPVAGFWQPEPEKEYLLHGTIKDKAGNPIADVIVKIGDKTAITDASGNWQIAGLSEGSYILTATKAGYSFASQNISIEKGKEIATVTIAPPETQVSVAKGDIDGKGSVDLADAILVLQVLAGINPPDVNVGADVNSDNKIGLEEVVYILQKAAELR